MVHIKKITALTISLVICLSSVAFAQEAEETPETMKIDDVKVSIQYDSVFYPAKLFFERIRLVNSFTDEGKANVTGIFAKRRLAEANYMIEQGELDTAQELMISSLDYLAQATEHIAQAIMHKDTGRVRLILENTSQLQSGVLQYFTDIEENYPDTFEVDQMIIEVKEDVVDIMVLWTYLSYKENILENAEVRQGARVALDSAQLENGQLNIDSIASATIEALDEAGVSLTPEEIDAIASATYDIMVEEGIGSEGVIDAITSATQDLLAGEPTAQPGVDTTTSATTVLEESGLPGTTLGGSGTGIDTTSSATTTTEPTTGTGGGGGTTSGSSGGSGVDTVSSATTTTSSGGSGSSGIVLYNDDHDDDHDDDRHEDREDDDDHDDDDHDDDDHDEHEDHDDDD